MALPLWFCLHPTTPPGWLAIPVTTDLHPVAFDYGVRYQQLLETQVGGPRGNPVLAPILAQADVHWRLLEATGEGLPVDRPMETRWRDTALASSALAFSTLVEETFDRDPRMHALHVAADTVVNPSIEIARGPAGVRVDHPRGGSTAARLGRSEAELGLPTRPRRPAVRAGLDWGPREDDPDDPRDDDSGRLLDWSAYLSASDLGLTQLRADMSLVDRQWSVTAREALGPRLSLLASSRSALPDAPRPHAPPPPPGRISLGGAWAFPGIEGWSLRVDRIQTLATGDVTWMLTLRADTRTPIPGRTDPPLGGDGLPEVPDRTPNELGAW
jgi:hypothetical protein